MIKPLLTVAAAATVCYTPYGQDVEPEFYANQALVQIVWGEVPSQDAEAESSYYYDEETGTSVCKIWVQSVPKLVLGDPMMDALGHELLHCLTGNFHE